MNVVEKKLFFGNLFFFFIFLFAKIKINGYLQITSLKNRYRLGYLPPVS